MSIWSSIPRDLVFHTRNNYTGEKVEGEEEGFLDVATAVPWHHCIRLCVDGKEIMLDMKEAADLTVALHDAQSRIADLRYWAWAQEHKSGPEETKEET